MNAYTVEKYCEIDKVWACVYRNGKGDLFSSLKGAKAYVTRNFKQRQAREKASSSYRINTYKLELEKTETI